ncbi:hypothetical protein BY458DRAFT_501279 [Sporodiniella umbellata]|nr:hypothetical protein BY458DRAFT_501279 [Sporodiniella umbellata]
MTTESNAVNTNPHAEKAQEALKKLKQLSSSLDGWNLTQEKDKVKLYNQKWEGSDVPVVRGDYLIEGDHSVPEVLSVCFLSGCRKIWDDKLDDSDVKDFYGRYQALFWTKMKAPWPISPRDAAVTSLAEFSDNESYIALTSVIDSRIPEISGNVRANLNLSGWKVTKVDNGVLVNYITHVELGGSIPGYFLKNAMQYFPLCAGKVGEYVQQYSSPPLFVGGTATIVRETFEHDKRRFTAILDGEGEAKWVVLEKMFPKGFAVEISSKDVSAEVNGQEVTVKGITGRVEVTIVKAK